jgi:hypothetical protein
MAWHRSISTCPQDGTVLFSTQLHLVRICLPKDERLRDSQLTLVFLSFLAFLLPRYTFGASLWAKLVIKMRLVGGPEIFASNGFLNDSLYETVRQ